MSCHVMLCYVMLCYVMLCHVMLCYVMLCYVMLCYVMLCYVMLCYVMLCYVYMQIFIYIHSYADDFQIDVEDNDDANVDDEAQMTKDDFDRETCFGGDPKRERIDLAMYEEFIKEMFDFTVRFSCDFLFFYAKFFSFAPSRHMQ